MTYATTSCVISLIKSYLLRFIVTCGIPFLFLGCSSQDSANTDGQESTTVSKPVVFVPISPYQFIFEKIAGDLIDIKVIVGEGDDPHFALARQDKVGAKVFGFVDKMEL